MAVGFCVVYAKNEKNEQVDTILRAYEGRWQSLSAVAIGRTQSGCFNAVHGSRQRDPLSAESDRSILLLAGRAYAPNPNDPPISVGQLLRDVEEHGPGTLHRLNGNYVAFLFDKAERRLTTVVDRPGNARAYAWETNDLLVIASQYTPLMHLQGCTFSLSESGLAEYLCFGCNLEDRTLFEGIRYLQGRHQLVYDGGSSTVSRYWDYQYAEGTDNRSVEDCGRAYLDLLCRAVQRRTTGKAVLPITAGMDARLIACALSKVRDTRTVPTFTLGRNNCYDVEDGRRIAKRLGFSHTAIDIPPTFFADYIAEGVDRTDADVIGHTCWRMAGDPFLRAHSGASVLSGCWGEFLRIYRDDPAMNPQWTLEETYQHHKRTHNEWLFMPESELPRLLRPDVYGRVAGHVDSTLRRLFLDAPAEHPRHKLEYMSLANWWPRRYVRMITDYYSDTCPVTFPYNDNELVDFSLGVPLDTRKNAAINRWIFANHFPKIAAIPYARTALPFHAGPAQMLYHRARGFARYKIAPLVKGRHTGNRGAYVHYRKWLRENNAAFVRDALAEPGPLADYLDMDNLRQSVNDVLEGRTGDYGKVYNIAALSIYLRNHRAS